jgi:eukaryotic-like serine/threonine-protein kinase
MLCIKCSAHIENDARICVTCGATLDPEAKDPLLGRVLLNQYVIQKKLGEGGFGAVYEAEQPAFHRKIAIKTLHRHLTSNKNVVARFHREGLLASKLESHPSAIKMLNLGQTEDGYLWIAMEYLTGGTLTDRINQGSISPEEMLEILGPVCELLDEAHRQGIVHRDLKPDNIMLVTQKGKIVPKVLDFGIAGIIDNPNETGITKTGTISGTPPYMSPEQWRGLKFTDARSDVYAVGVIVYQCLAGKLPFEARSTPDWMLCHMMQPPAPFPVAIAGRLMPVELKPAILKSLAKEPRDRYQSAGEFFLAISAAIESDPRDTVIKTTKEWGIETETQTDVDDQPSTFSSAKAIETPTKTGSDWRQTKQHRDPKKPPFDQEENENTDSWEAPRLTPSPKPEEGDSATSKQRGNAKVTHNTEQSVKDTSPIAQKPMGSQLLITLAIDDSAKLAREAEGLLEKKKPPLTKTRLTVIAAALMFIGGIFLGSYLLSQSSAHVGVEKIELGSEPTPSPSSAATRYAAFKAFWVRLGSQPSQPPNEEIPGSPPLTPPSPKLPERLQKQIGDVLPKPKSTLLELLSNKQIDDVMSKLNTSLCLADGTGKVTMTITINDTGTVNRVTGNTSPLSSCLERLILDLKFPQFSASSQTTIYPVYVK